MNNASSESESKDHDCKIVIEKKDLYEILGVKKDASEDEIRRSYKKMAVKFHPDKNNSKYAADAFKKVSHAFSVLSNKEKKQRYDTFGTEEEVGMPQGAHFGRGDDPFVRKFLMNFI
jgi:DnaJ-class molecular chaperone